MQDLLKMLRRLHPAALGSCNRLFRDQDPSARGSQCKHVQQLRMEQVHCTAWYAQAHNRNAAPFVTGKRGVLWGTERTISAARLSCA
jgi:hypothetical protein